MPSNNSQINSHGKSEGAGGPGYSPGFWRSGRAGLCLALLAFLFEIAAGPGSRFGLWTFRTGFEILKWAAWGGLIAALVSFGGVYSSARRRCGRSFSMALAGLLAGIAVFAVPLSWKLHAKRAPVIHDISTDTDNPPQFIAILPLRQNAPNSTVYGGREVAIKQNAAYPDINSIVLNMPADQAFARALDTARSMGWHIVVAEAKEGRIEASDTTLWFGFTDDIVIRISTAENRSIVDIRSVSRVGKSDVGTNAKRIRAFLAKMNKKM